MRTCRYSRAVRFVPPAAALMLFAGGCGSLTSREIKAPNVNAQSAAAEAIRLYDKDADGQLNDSELAACPAINSAKYDTNKDGRVSGDEIAQRLQQIYAAGIGVMEVHCSVARGGRPLEGATVRFVPEPFLGDAILPASGTTDSRGATTPSVSGDQLPGNLRNVSVMQAGLYRVEIEHPSLTAANKKPLGFEVDPTSREGNAARFNL
jgi:hypothetical protein